MSDETRNGRIATQEAGDDEREVARLLAAAGARPELPAEDLAEIRAAVREAWRARAPVAPAAPAVLIPSLVARRRRWLIAAALAAMLVAALGVTRWWPVQPPPANTELVAKVESSQGDARLALPNGEERALVVGAALPAGSELRTEAGARAGFVALRLAGGGSLRLDAGSRVRLLARATVALEQGAVYADSGESGAAARIVVRTPLGEVRELGTQFTVRLRDDGRELRVRVREGSVVAAVAGARHAAVAGEELVVDARGRAERRPAAVSGADWHWVLAASPGFASEGRTVGELLAWTARETGWRLRYEDEAARAAASTVLHGGLGALPPDRTPFAVLPGAGLEAELRDGTLLVRLSH